MCAEHYERLFFITRASFVRLVQFHFLIKIAIKNISPPKKSPIPDKKQIVLNGCPKVVVKPKPPNIQPKIIDVIDITILLVLFIA